MDSVDEGIEWDMGEEWQRVGMGEGMGRVGPNPILKGFGPGCDMS